MIKKNKMKTYNISFSMDVEAKNEEEALYAMEEELNNANTIIDNELIVKEIDDLDDIIIYE